MNTKDNGFVGINSCPTCGRGIEGRGKTCSACGAVVNPVNKIIKPRVATEKTGLKKAVPQKNKTSDKENWAVTFLVHVIGFIIFTPILIVFFFIAWLWPLISGFLVIHFLYLVFTLLSTTDKFAWQLSNPVFQKTAMIIGYLTVFFGFLYWALVVSPSKSETSAESREVDLSWKTLQRLRNPWQWW